MEPVVRFAAQRAVQLAAPGHPSLVPAFDPAAAATPFLSTMRHANTDALTGQRMAQEYLAHRGTHPFGAVLDALGLKLMAGVSSKDLLAALQTATDAPSASWNPAEPRARCADDLLAMALDPSAVEAERTLALHRMRVLLVTLHAKLNEDLSEPKLTAWAAQLVVLLPPEARRTPPVPPTYTKPPQDSGNATDVRLEVIDVLGKARRAMRSFATPGETVQMTPLLKKKPKAGGTGSTGHDGENLGGSGQPGTGGGGTTTPSTPPAPAPAPADTQARIDLGRSLGVKILSPRHLSDTLARVLEDIGVMHPPAAGLAPAVPRPRTGALVRPPGIMDLMVIRQKPIGYEPGEIAHIENVMRQETRERLHRRVDTTEVTDTVTQERISEQEKETQTTARADLSTEATSLARLDARVAGRVNTSGQYGPTKVVTDISGGVDYSRQTAEKNASSYAKELTERASSKLVERTESQRTTRTTTQIDEMVKHVVEAKGATAHIVGIYRWVNRIYECSLWKYEGRMVCEFQIPEPSSWYRWWRDQERAVPGAGSPPPTLEDLQLTNPATIGPWAIPVLQSRLGLTGLTAPPQFVKRVPFTITKAPAGPWDGTTDDSKGSMQFLSVDIVVPDGYAAVSVSWQARVVGLMQHAWLKIGANTNILVANALGDQNLGADTWMSDSQGDDVAIDDQPTGTVKVAAYTRAAGVEILGDVTCFADPSLLTAWQLSVHEKAVTAINAVRTAYESRTRAGSVLRSQISARPSAELRGIEQNELKRAVIELLEGPGTIGEEGWVREQPNGPLLDPDVARYGRTVQFLEQAFEWGNLDQVYYPYFWAARERWSELQAESDADPQFGDFLRSGSARVTVPVAPGFETVVQAYLAGMGVWGGGAAPAIDDPLYRGIAAELLERMNGPAGGTQVGSSWRLTLPTTLVYLQESSTLPAPPALPTP